jgi:hypothetical protein
MNSNHVIRYTIIVAALVLIAWVPAATTQAADQPQASPTSSAPTKEHGIVAAGAVEDSLNSCLARIPKDASAGQRMVAEQGCQRDQASRGSAQVLLTF